MDTSTEHRTPEEIADALRELCRDETRLLLAMAAKFSYQTGLEPRDLLHAAIEKALSGERLCPVDVPVMAFLINAIRSIAHNERERKLNRCSSLDIVSENVQESLLDSIPCPSLTPEEVLIHKDYLHKQQRFVIDLIIDDKDAQLFVHAYGQGWSIAQIKANLGFDDKKIEAIQTKIRRRAHAARKGDLHDI